MEVLREGLIIGVTCLLLYGFWKLTLSPLLRYRSFLRKVGVNVMKCPPPPIGHLLQMSRDAEEGLLTAFKFYCSFREKIPYIWRGTQPLFYLNTPQLVQQALQHPQLIERGPTYRLLHPWVQLGLFSGPGEKWRVRRKMIAPAFHFSVLKNYFISIKERTEVLVKVIYEHAASEEAVDVRGIMANYSIDLLCETVMGVHPDAQRSGGADDYLCAAHRALDLIFSRSIQPIFWIDWIYYSTAEGREFHNCVQVMHSFAARAIENRKAELESIRKRAGNEPKDPNIEKKSAFLDLLLEKLEEGVIDSNGVQEEVNTFMFGGHETTANALVWGLQCLSEAPDVQCRIHKELDSVFNDPPEGIGRNGPLRSITFDDLSNLTFIDKVVREVLRLYPSVHMMIRRAMEDVTLEIGGEKVVLPAGIELAIIPYYIHRDERLYPDPERFDPDRFDLKNSELRHSFAYIPFGGGPRNCIGQKFAMMEMKVALAEIFRRFRVVALQTRDSIGLKPEVTLRPRRPVRIKFIPRC